MTSMLDHLRIGRQRVARFVLLTLATAGNGCDFDECPVGALRCNGKLAQICEPRGSDDPTLAWYTKDCGDGFCHLSTDPADRNPFCAQTEEPDPSCTQKAGATDLLYCSGNEAIACHQGYVESTFDCSPAQTWGDTVVTGSPRTASGYCITVATWVDCAVDPTPNPLCANAAASYVVCDGNRLLECEHGYATYAFPCPSTGLCVPKPNHSDFCTMTSTPDPACPPDDPDYYTCKGNVISECSYGYVVRQDPPCPAGSTCSAAYHDASCMRN